MGMNPVGSLDNSYAYSLTPAADNSTASVADPSASLGSARAKDNSAALGNAANNQNAVEQEKDQRFSKENLKKVTKEINGIMDSLDVHIQFKLHEKTKRLIVQVIDSRDQSVIKEFPPHQLLDTIAAIRDQIGVLLDKHA